MKSSEIHVIVPLVVVRSVRSVLAALSADRTLQLVSTLVEIDNVVDHTLSRASSNRTLLQMARVHGETEADLFALNA